MIRRVQKISHSSFSKTSLDLSGKKSKIVFYFNVSTFLTIIFLVYLIILKVPFLKKQDVSVKEKLDRVPTVEVLNGCGYPGIAEKFTDLIRAKNFDVVKTSNFATFDVDTTFVIDRIGDKKYALALADSLKIPHQNVIQHYNKNYFLDVTFVIGKDFNNYIKR